MHLSWQELRTVTLAQALERADTERTLVSQIGRASCRERVLTDV